jgi:methionine biosynthesis protein MetW
MPETETIPARWYDTPNIHFCTILDFVDLCAELGVEIERSLSINPRGQANTLRDHRLANIFGEQGMFLLRKR